MGPNETNGLLDLRSQAAGDERGLGDVEFADQAVKGPTLGAEFDK